MGSDQQIAFFLRELKDGDTWRRAAAAKGLGRLRRDEHAWVLVGSADDRAPEVREAVAAGLGRLGVAEAGRTVLPALMGDEDPWVRRRASRAAIRLGLDDPAAVEAYSRLLRDPDHHLRINALDALGALGVPGRVPGLVALLGDPESAVWGRARVLLYRFRHDPAVHAEVVRTAELGVGDARVRALQAGRWDTVRLLLPLLGDPDGDVRAGAVAGLGTLVDDGLQPWERRSVARALVAHLAADPSTVWQTHNALIGLTEALPGLRLTADRTPSADVRAAALSLLDTHNATDENTGDDLARFVHALDDPDETVRFHAAEGLAHWLATTGRLPRDEERLRAQLAALASDSGAATRAVAEEALLALDGCRP
ncbi:HEAT repeat protein [Streptomyces sp. V4I8]|uniref:HEAT repeat domain-containing protein n=1 Tax=Streptomyces sp. V4I8 TaxID=3156469 RepID=UPI0035130BFC